MLEASHLALGEGTVESVIAPDQSPDRGIGGGRAASIEDIRSSSRVRRGLRGITRGKAGEAFRVGVLVAIDQSRGDLLTHTFEEGTNLGQTEVSGVAVEVRNILVDNRVGFKVAAGVNDLRSRGLGIRDTGVQQTPRSLRQARANRGLVARRQVAFHDKHVVKDFVGLRQDFDDGRDLVAIVHSFGPVGISDGQITNGCHI